MSETPQGPESWQPADGTWNRPAAPTGPPPSEGSNRVPLFVALGVLGLAAVGALAFTLGKGDDDPGSERSSKTTAEQPETSKATTPTTEAPEVNPIEVLDQGFSNYVDSDNAPKAGYGFVVQNTGDDIFRDIKTTITFYAAGDKVITTENFTVGVLRPGEKIGLGGELISGELAGAVVERVEAKVPYMPEAAAPGSVPDGGFEVGNISTEASSLFLKTSFTVSTTYSTDVIFPVASAIYRNSAGAIVGGATTTGLVEPGGTLVPQAEISTWSIFPDVASTEVYIDPGLIT